MEESFRTGAPDRETVAEEIEQGLHWALDVMWEKQCFMRVSVSRAAIDPEIGRTITARLHRERARLIAAKLRRHQQAGRIPVSVDADIVAEMIVGLAFAYGFADQVMTGMDRDRVRHVAEVTAALITRGLTAPAAAEEPSPSPQGAAQR